MAFVPSVKGMYVLRFFIGVFEASSFPGITCILCAWYTPRELALRLAIFGSSYPAAQIFVGFMQVRAPRPPSVTFRAPRRSPLTYLVSSSRVVLVIQAALHQGMEGVGGLAGWKVRFLGVSVSRLISCFDSTRAADLID